ncbi:MAG TPA: CPBP family intramembrane glutamic endopeptidase [Blastocatellia bacterium]
MLGHSKNRVRLLLKAAAFVFVTSLVFNANGGFLEWAEKRGLLSQPLSMLFTYSVPFLLVLFYSYKDSRWVLSEFSSNRVVNNNQLAIRDLYPFTYFALLLIIPVVLVVSGLLLLENYLLGPLIMRLPIWKHSNVLEASHPGWMTMIIVAVIAPILEEGLMRGIVLRLLLIAFSVPMAIAINGILFGLLHLNLRQGVLVILPGCFFAWLFVRTRSLSLPVVAHALWNLLRSSFEDAGLALRVALDSLLGIGLMSKIASIAFALILLLVGFKILSKRLSMNYAEASR